MMKYLLTVLLFSALLISCGNATEEAGKLMGEESNQLVQKKEVNGYTYRLSYLPQGIQQEELAFKLTVQLPLELKGSNTSRKELSFGLDTLFHLVTGNDTLMPLHTLRVANGDLKGIEYMIVFPRAAAANPNATVVFSDWYFSSRSLEFPLKMPAILKLDSLSARI